MNIVGDTIQVLTTEPFFQSLIDKPNLIWVAPEEKGSARRA